MAVQEQELLEEAKKTAVHELSGEKNVDNSRAEEDELSGTG